MIDRNPSHGALWLAITVLFVMMILMAIASTVNEHHFNDRIKALEEQR